MFDKLIREMEKLQKTRQVTVHFEADKDGYLDKECPSESCKYQFKVSLEDWNNFFNEEVIYCPLCKHESHSKNWFTEEQVKFGEESAGEEMKRLVNNALIIGAKDFNRNQPKNSFIKMSMNVKVGRTKVLLPKEATDEMQQKIKCKECNARYAVIGNAYFCPCCGYNSIEDTFDNSLLKIESKIKNIDIIKNALQNLNKDEVSNTIQSLIESSLNEGLVAFQRYCEATFLRNHPNIKVTFNAFQKLDVGGEYWQKLIGESYINWLRVDEYKSLIILFQKRHLLSHTEGIVDQKYIDKSNDNTYKVGQRIVIKESDVFEMVEYIRKIVLEIRAKILK
jgi:hypothetical protein